jgi:hypothetical protein
MKFSKTVGLVGAAGVTGSYVARMPALLDHLGPVKGAPLRVSRRIANSLRAGQGVADFAALQRCELILIFVPESQLDALSEELAATVALEHKMIVLCDVFRDSLQPSPLRTAGARVATLNCLPETNEKVFVSEGHPAALAELRRLLSLDERKLVELEPASKPLYLLGLHLGTHLLLPWIAGAVESLRTAGFTRNEATRAVYSFGEAALRSYGKAGEKAWNRDSAERLQSAIQRDIDAIRVTDARLAALLSPENGHALRYFAKPPKRAAAAGRAWKAASSS